MTFKAIVLIFL